MLNLKFKKRLKAIPVFVMLFLPFFGGGHALAQAYNFPELIEKVAMDKLPSVNVGTLDEWVSGQKTDGSWSDLHYGYLTSATASSTSDNHLLRLWQIAGSSANPGHSKYNDVACKNAVKKGLDFWFQSNTVDPNWWFNKIYFPQKLGEILIFMREFSGFIAISSATEIDETQLLSLFFPTSIPDITSHGNGANAIDIALHYLYRGILSENGKLLEDMRDHLELVLAANIKGDDIYHDHGPQIQIASYGWVFSNGITLLAYYLANTPAAFDLNSDNFNTVIRFIRETQISTARGGTWDFSVMGRAVSRPNGMNASLNYLQRLVVDIDPDNATYYTDAMDRARGNKPANYNVREFNKHYWASDYSQHARSEFLFSVRNVSTRTVEAETGNGENLKANYFSYGATFISADGKEYSNIMPVWDWAMIPGTTFPHVSTFPSRTTWGTNFGQTKFVGGVSNDQYGAAVLDLKEAGITAKKSWFFFEEEIVCLGAGINDNSGNNVRTTVNQCWMEAPSYYKELNATGETMKSVSSTTVSNSNLAYIRQGNFAYYFPEQGDVKFSMKSQIGSWKDINLSHSDVQQSGYVFSLWFDHGSNPYNGKYHYVVVPGIDSEAKAAAYNQEAIEITENSSSVQAVYHQTLDLLQAIFHDAGSLTHNGVTITVNKPCALMFENGTLVTVSDPAQENSVIQVSVHVNGVDYNRFVSMPGTTQLKGSSVTLDFNIASTTSNVEENESLSIACFPNPTIGLLHITSGIGKSLDYVVRNLKGQQIFIGSFQSQTIIDLNDLPAGLYFLNVNGQGKNFNQKIIRY